MTAATEVKAALEALVAAEGAAINAREAHEAAQREISAAYAAKATAEKAAGEARVAFDSALAAYIEARRAADT